MFLLHLIGSRVNLLVFSINDVFDKLDVICPHSHLGLLFVWFLKIVFNQTKIIQNEIISIAWFPLCVPLTPGIVPLVPGPG